MVYSSSRGYAFALVALWFLGSSSIGEATLQRHKDKKEDVSLRGSTDAIVTQSHAENKSNNAQSHEAHSRDEHGIIVHLKQPQGVLELEHPENTGPMLKYAVSIAAGPTLKYGDADCACVGIDEVDGKTLATLKDGSSVSYPADLGSRCEAWDANKHPKCPGEPWCKQKWCYVDPCKCKGVSVLPKPSIYLPGAMYQGRPVHFSYATCGAVDSYSSEDEKKSAEDIKETCAAKVDSATWGKGNCRCIGIGPQKGTTKVTIKDKLVDFPADTGSTCKTWEKNNHPECQSKNPPGWCSQAWCYVDPCSCKLEEPPKTSSYLPKSYYQGKPVYYSYATCGSVDSYTVGQITACVNQKTSSACRMMSKCAWTGSECLGKELASVCASDQHAGGLRAKISIAVALLVTCTIW